MRGRLNVFQASMLRWREVHPYNAVHVIRIAKPLDPLRLQTVIDNHLAALGLTGLVLDGVRERYHYTGGETTTPLHVIVGDSDPQRVVCGEIERQLNRSFAREGRIEPFRFFAVDGRESFHLGVAYDHFIAGGDSIVVLLKGLLERYSDISTKTLPLELYPPRFRRLLVRHPWRVLRGTRQLWELPASCRRAFRPRIRALRNCATLLLAFASKPPMSSALAAPRRPGA